MPPRRSRRAPSETVRVAVSLSDQLFAAAETLARSRGLTRSQLYTQALLDLLESSGFPPGRSGQPR